MILWLLLMLNPADAGALPIVEEHVTCVVHQRIHYPAIDKWWLNERLVFMAPVQGQMEVIDTRHCVKRVAVGWREGAITLHWSDAGDGWLSFPCRRIVTCDEFYEVDLPVAIDPCVYFPAAMCGLRVQ